MEGNFVTLNRSEFPTRAGCPVSDELLWPTDDRSGALSGRLRGRERTLPPISKTGRIPQAFVHISTFPYRLHQVATADGNHEQDHAGRSAVHEREDRMFHPEGAAG